MNQIALQTDVTPLHLAWNEDGNRIELNRRMNHSKKVDWICDDEVELMTANGGGRTDECTLDT